jgi:ATP-dependent DNA helicase RecG
MFNNHYASIFNINPKNASIMIIEHSERFGLSQLHQLRGRVGRGEKQSTCILMYSHPISIDGRKRLEIMRKTNDGFLIAEEDLSIRGGGEILGTKQSGIPEFKFADYSIHKDLFITARQDAKLIIETDPYLKSDRGQALKILLYLFEQDIGIKYLEN